MSSVARPYAGLYDERGSDRGVDWRESGAYNCATMKLLIKNGRLVDPSRTRCPKRDILVSDGRIARIAPRISTRAPVIDADGCLVLPGLIDLHCHLREPGQEEKETIETGTRAAVAGGFTTVCCMPNTIPPLDNRIAIGFVRARSRQAACEVLPIGAITVGREGKALAPYGEMVEEGAVGFSDDGSFVMDSQLMRRALEYSKLFGTPVISHAEDQSLTKNGVMNEGALSTKLGLPGAPREAEEIAISRDIALARLTGGRLHIAHVTTAAGVDLIRRAKKEGLAVTCEVTVHHLVLTEEAVAGYDTNAKVSPPLRTEDDIKALIRGLKDGTIDAIVTDHAPHTREEKESGFEEAPFGMIGFETALSLALSLQEEGLSLQEIVAKMTVGPAKAFGLHRGMIADGRRADLVIFDPDRQWVYARESVVSKSANSPFLNRTLKGKVVATISNGKIAYQSQME